MASYRQWIQRIYPVAPRSLAVDDANRKSCINSLRGKIDGSAMLVAPDVAICGGVTQSTLLVISLAIATQILCRFCAMRLRAFMGYYT